jgi:hypothetical protein
VEEGYFNATGQAIVSANERCTVIMAHAMFWFNGDVVPASNDFTGGKVNGVALDDFLG